MNIVGLKSITPRVILQNIVRKQSTTNTMKQSSIKKLMSKYGYSALIVYIGVTFISLPTCYFTVHSLGEEKISILLNRGKQIFGYGEKTDELVKLKVEARQLARIEAREKYIVEEIDDNNVKNTSVKEKLKLRWDSIKTSPILTELILAYGLHKSLIFIRIPLTAAITPTFARILPTRFVSKTSRHTVSTVSTVNRNANKGSLGNDVYLRQKKTGFQKWFNGLF